MSYSSTVTCCTFCSSKDLELILDLGKQPLANSLRKELSIDLPLIDLRLLFCKTCSLIQISEIVDPQLLFQNYFWVTGTSKITIDYSKVFCNRILEKTPQKTNNYVLEIASNDGTFLKEFLNKNNNVLGVDPAKNIAKIANKKNIPTLSSFFNKETATNILEKNGQFDIVIARNVIPHVKEIHSIFEGVSMLLKNNGIGVIEFHYLKKILEEIHYDSIYHEHLFYFSLKTINNFLKRYNLFMFDIDESPISGGSLVVYFSNQQKDISTKLQDAINYESKNKINELDTWKNFGYNCLSHAKTLKKMVSVQKEKGLIIGYGASARSATLLNFCKINSSDIFIIYDKNKLKQNLYTPGSNIQISFPLLDKINSKENLTIIILAWNFKDEIIEYLKEKNYSGSIIIPLPNEPILYEF